MADAVSPLPASTPGITNGLVLVLAATASFAIANNYTLQPLLPEVASSFGRASRDAGWIAAAAPFGYTLGLLIFLPLGDHKDLRALIVGQLLGLAVALLLVALSPNFACIVLAGIVAGALATSAAQCAALGARLAGARRGFVIGSISMGVSLGILLGRVLGGAIGGALGWRAMVLVTSAGAFGFAALVGLVIPGQRRHGNGSSFGAILRATLRAFTSSPPLRASAGAGALWFCTFSAIWACLSLHLASPPMGYGPSTAGLFGVIGVVGAFTAQSAGRAVDRHGSFPIILAGMAIAASGLVVMVNWPTSLIGLAVGILLLDAGCFAAQAANQVKVLALAPHASGRYYAAYMVVYYTAGTVGALAAPALLSAAGWGVVCASGMALLVLAAAGAASCSGSQ